MTNQGRPLRPQDLYTAQALWLLEVEWAGRQYRWATELPDGGALVITTADGVDMEYRGGAGISWESKFALMSESASPPVISLDLWFDAIEDVPQRVADGDDLSAMTMSVYRWAPGMTYEDRLGVFYGVSQQPSYGSTAEPVKTTFESPIYRDGGLFPDGAMTEGALTADAGTLKGQPYPLIFGNPAYADGTLSLQAGSPAYPLSDTPDRVLVGMALGGKPLSGGTLWNVSDDSSLTSTGAFETDAAGRAVYVHTVTAGTFAIGSSYAMEWSGDDIGAGELLELCAKASTLRVDLSRFATVRSQLDLAFRFSGYIDAATSPWQWAQRNILTLLPGSAAHSAQGLYVQVWDDQATAADALASLDTSNGIVRVGPVQYEQGELVNEFTIRYAPDQSGELTKTRTVTGRLGQGVAPEYIVSPYARASVSRLAAIDAAGPLQGVRSKVIDTPFIRDDATAMRCALWRIRANGSRRRVVTVRDTQGHLEWLGETDHVLLTDPEIALSNQLAMVRSRRWTADGGFFLDLVLLDDLFER